MICGAFTKISYLIVTSRSILDVNIESSSLLYIICALDLILMLNRVGSLIYLELLSNTEI